MTETQTTALPKETPASAAQGESPPTADTANRDGDSESLRAYMKNKLALAAQLHVLCEIIRQRGSETRLQQCRDLMAKLAEDRFTLAVLGQFKRGKSSLMNAIIGRELLPVGVLPLTSAITVLRFGPKERLLITRSDVMLIFPEEFPVERLAEFVTEKENPGNRRHVKTACVELPVPFLRRGLEFVDTPGVGSAIEANTQTTLKFLPECDAVLFVTSVDSPFTRVELEFLESIRQHVRKIFFIVNKTDLLGSGERREVLDFVGDTIRSQMGTEDVKIFPVSSRLGLAAKLDGDWSEGLESGLNELENALARFLAGEKATVFLAAIADKVLRLLEQESVEVKLREHAAEIPEPVLLQTLETVTTQWREHEAARRKIFAQLREHVVSQNPLALTPELASFLSSQAGRLARHIQRLLAHASWQPGLWVGRRCDAFALRQLRRSAWTWLTGQAVPLSFTGDDSVLRHWRKLQANVSDIPAFAAEAFRLSDQRNHAADMLPPLRLDVKFDPPFLPDFRWRTRVPWQLAALPVFVTRRWLKQHWRKESELLMQGFHDQILAFVAGSVGKALDDLEKIVESGAVETGSRVMAVIRGAPSADPNSNGEALEVVRHRLLSLRDAIPQIGMSASASEETISATFAEPAEPRVPEAPHSTHVPDVDATRHAATRGCAVCDALGKAAFEFFSHWQYSLFCDERAQRDFAAELGFCPLHIWQLAAVSSPVGASLGWAKLVERLSQIISRAADSSLAAQYVSELVRRPDNCRACRRLREAERNYVRQVATNLHEPHGREAYARPQGLCLRHLGMVLAASPDSGATHFLLSQAARGFEQMAEDMQSFGMKTEALRRHLRNRDEEDAYLRAIIHIAGAKANCFPWDGDAEL